MYVYISKSGFVESAYNEYKQNKKVALLEI